MYDRRGVTALKNLDDFNWRFNASISRKDIYEVTACHFIRKVTDVLFGGPPGVGKTYLAQSIGQPNLSSACSEFLRRFP